MAGRLLTMVCVLTGPVATQVRAAVVVTPVAPHGQHPARLSRGVHGSDSRVDEADTSPEWRDVGRATVMLVRRHTFDTTWAIGDEREYTSVPPRAGVRL